MSIDPDHRDRSVIHRRLAAALFVAGALLMAFKIREDSEPGAIPLLLVLASIAWFVTATVRARRARSGASRRS